MIDPYAMLGIERDADDNQVKAAYRKAAKGMHPDSGGDVDQFARLQTCYDLLRDPVRRKVFDDTGFDPQLADPRDLKGLMLLEPLVNDVILDEREPGSFDPLAAMRRKLSDDPSVGGAVEHRGVNRIEHHDTEREVISQLRNQARCCRTRYDDVDCARHSRNP